MDRRAGNRGGRSRTRRMPRELGPKAETRVEKGMLPVVGWECVRA